VVFDGRVLAIGSVTSGSTTHNLYALDRDTGALLWAHPIPAIIAGSWSSPAIDARNHAAIVASGTQVRCVDLASGALRWQATLARSVVNASPVLTTDLPGRNRVFITDYDGVGTDGRLYCINAESRSGANPWDPGQIVWSVPVGATSGNTPAYLGRRVYVATVGDWTFAPGEVHCFPADADTPPTPIWAAQNPKLEGFFGGVAVGRDRWGDLSVFAASYAFYGGTSSANLVKIDAASGAVRWSVDANRTSATPVIMPDGRVALSTGVNGYGSVPALQIFRDHGETASLLWDSSIATWNDANANGVRDAGEFTSVGGWSNQPALGRLDGRLTLFAGVMPASASSTASCSQLRAIDLESATPVFLAMTSTSAGSTPAIVDENLFSIGPAGLAAFGPIAPRYDVDGNNVINLNDLHAWHQGIGQRDVNRDAAVTPADAQQLEAELQRQGAPH
jgi:outer membrane protein assembly factor BamB